MNLAPLAALLAAQLPQAPSTGSLPAAPKLRTGPAPVALVTASGTSDEHLTIRSERPGQPSAVLISSVELLHFELAGRVALHELDRSRPQLIARAGQPTYLELPDGSRVFHYKRSDESGFGFFKVTVSGTLQILAELPPEPGDDGSSGDNPWLPAIGASRDGKWLAAATDGDATGDLYLLSASGGAPVLLTPEPEPADIDESSFTFASGALFVTMDSDAVARAPIPTGPLAPVALPPSGDETPEWVAPEIAVSEDGSAIALVAGEGIDQADVYVVSAAGSAVNVTQDPSRYRPLSAAPLFQWGPRLALSDDGSRVAYLRAQYPAGTYPLGYTGEEDELYLATSTGSQKSLVTGDAWFHPWIGTGITVGFQGAFLQFGFAGITGKFDYYTAYAPLQAGYEATVWSSTLTGSGVPQFQDVATMVPAAVRHVPGAPAWIALDGGSAPGLRYVTPTFLTNATILPLPTHIAAASAGGPIVLVAPFAGGHGIFALRDSASRPDVSYPAWISPAETPSAISTAPTGSFAAVSSSSAAGAMLHVVDITAGGEANISLGLGSDLESVSFAAANQIRVAFRLGALRHAAAFSPMGQNLLQPAPAPVLYLLR
ncbi:MAG: hypothetical protein JNJ88_17320 [Planctomycetes bacterium]|nr:hypothetical protein [Planctomycetota bacterium]